MMCLSVKLFGDYPTDEEVIDLIKSGGPNCVRLALTAALLLALMATLLPATDAADSDSVQILYIDDYSKSVRAGENATYNWTIRSLNPTVQLTVNVSTDASAEQWSYTLATPSIILEPSGLASVQATVTAPFERGDRYDNLTVYMYVYEDSHLVQVSAVNADTAILGALASAEKVLGYFENPLPSPLDNEWGVFLLDVVIWLVIAAGIAFLLDGIGRVLARATASMLEKIIMGILRTPVLILVFIYGIVHSLDALHMHISESIRDSVYSIYSVIVVIIIFYLAYKIFKNVLVYYGKVIAKRTASKVDDILIPVVEKVGIVVIGFAALIYALAALKVDLTAFVLGGTFISLVIAFAAQETISNFFSGIFILLDRPFKEGDIIILSDGDWCEVRKIGLRTTKLFRYSEASIIAIPNNKLVNEKIANFSSAPDKGRIMMTFGVSYDSDTQKVKEIIREVINSCPYIIKDNPDLTPIVRFEEMADSSLNFFILAWLNDRADRFDAKDFLNSNIFRRFNEENIEIPFPQSVVHLRKEDS